MNHFIAGFCCFITYPDDIDTFLVAFGDAVTMLASAAHQAVAGAYIAFIMARATTNVLFSWLNGYIEPRLRRSSLFGPLTYFFTLSGFYTTSLGMVLANVRLYTYNLLLYLLP